jgi:glycosyltransferase involved in cell wall biosynthesis
VRVVHVDSAHEWRGSQSQVLLTAVEMAGRGHDVTVACQAGGALEGRARATGIPVRPLAFGGDLRPGAILGLLRVLRDTRPEVVHVHDPHATAAGLLAVRLVNGRRPWLVASRRVPLPLHGAFSRIKYGACDRVLAVSEAVARGLVQGGLCSDRVRVVHDGVPDRLPPTDGADIAAEFGVPASAPIIGSVAALSEHKDHATLLSAMPAVLDAVPEARLLIVGEGRLRPRLESEVRGRGLGGRCVFAGFRSDVDRLMPGFSLLCLTSRIEGLGSTLLDAMCFSRAIVATETGGTPEAVRHGETGLLVPVGDSRALTQALVDLLTDRSRREIMGEAGRRRFVSEFTSARMVERTLDVYEELCASPAGSESAARVRAIAPSIHRVA